MPAEQTRTIPQQGIALIRFILRRLGYAKINQVAGNLTYTSILAIVPIVAVALAVFTTVPAFGSLQETLDAYFAQIMMPEEITQTIQRYLTTFAEKASGLSIFGAIGMVVTSVLMVGAIEETINQIWLNEKTRPFLKRYALLFFTAILGPVIFSVSMSITSYVYLMYRDSLNAIPMGAAFFSTAISILWATCGFTLFYYILPNRVVRFKEAVSGGVFAAIAFEMLKRLFAVFVLYAHSYDVIYGAIAVIPLLLIWIYAVWTITLTGAALTASLHAIWFERWEHTPSPGSSFIDALSVLEQLYLVQKDDPAYQLNNMTIRGQTGLGVDEIDGLLEAMKNAGWVNSDKKARNWQLNYDPNLLTLSSIYQCFVFHPTKSTPLTRQISLLINDNLDQSLAEYFEYIEKEGLRA